MIEVRDLCHEYPDGTVALRNIRLTVPEGEFLLICGPNGSGKTTLVRHLCGLLQPSGGTVTVDGIDARRHPRRVRELVGMVFQEADAQILGETVAEDVAFGPENMGLSVEEVNRRVEEALAAVGLQRLAEKPCHLLSGGEKRRLAIAGVLAMRPRVIVFDEPFANLDYPGTRSVLERLIGLHRDGHTLIVTTHDVEKTIAHADRLAILAGGELAAAGEPQAMIAELERYEIRPPCYALLGERTLSWLAD